MNSCFCSSCGQVLERVEFRNESGVLEQIVYVCTWPHCSGQVSQVLEQIVFIVPCVFPVSPPRTERIQLLEICTNPQICRVPLLIPSGPPQPKVATLPISPLSNDVKQRQLELNFQDVCQYLHSCKRMGCFRPHQEPNFLCEVEGLARKHLYKLLTPLVRGLDQLNIPKNIEHKLWMGLVQILKGFREIQGPGNKFNLVEGVIKFLEDPSQELECGKDFAQLSNLAKDFKKVWVPWRCCVDSFVPPFIELQGAISSSWRDNDKLNRIVKTAIQNAFGKFDCECEMIFETTNGFSNILNEIRGVLIEKGKEFTEDEARDVFIEGFEAFMKFLGRIDYDYQKASHFLNLDGMENLKRLVGWFKGVQVNSFSVKTLQSILDKKELPPEVCKEIKKIVGKGKSCLREGNVLDDVVKKLKEELPKEKQEELAKSWKQSHAACRTHQDGMSELYVCHPQYHQYQEQFFAGEARMIDHEISTYWTKVGSKLSVYSDLMKNKKLKVVWKDKEWTLEDLMQRRNKDWVLLPSHGDQFSIPTLWLDHEISKNSISLQFENPKHFKRKGFYAGSENEEGFYIGLENEKLVSHIRKKLGIDIGSSVVAVNVHSKETIYKWSLTHCVWAKAKQIHVESKNGMGCAVNLPEFMKQQGKRVVKLVCMRDGHKYAPRYDEHSVVIGVPMGNTTAKDCGHYFTVTLKKPKSLDVVASMREKLGIDDASKSHVIVVDCDSGQSKFRYVDDPDCSRWQEEDMESLYERALRLPRSLSLLREYLETPSFDSKGCVDLNGFEMSRGVKASSLFMKLHQILSLCQIPSESAQSRNAEVGGAASWELNSTVHLRMKRIICLGDDGHELLKFHHQIFAYTDIKPINAYIVQDHKDQKKNKRRILGGLFHFVFKFEQIAERYLSVIASWGETSDLRNHWLKEYPELLELQNELTDKEDKERSKKRQALIRKESTLLRNRNGRIIQNPMSEEMERKQRALLCSGRRFSEQTREYQKESFHVTFAKK